jgi:hypothetical protein
VAVRRQQERGVGSAGWGAEFSRWVCFPVPRGQWGSAESGQSQVTGKRELCDLVLWHLSKIGGCCGSAQAAGEGYEQRWIWGII